MYLPLAVNGLVENSINDVAIISSIALDCVQCGNSEESKYFEVIRSTQNEVY